MTQTQSSKVYDHHRGTDPLLRQTGRWRAGIFLALNIAGFLAINLFWRYLATGEWLDLSPEAYRHALTAPMSEIFIRPLSIFSHPWMILISAVLLAAIIFVPIVMAVLYHEIIAMIFVLIVALAGQSVLLAFGQAVGCVLAARTRLRSDMPFFASMLGLAPVGVYLYVLAPASHYTAAMPLQRWLLSAPLGLAALLAILMTAASLAAAKLTKFRPGIMWPILLIMLGGPVLMFHHFIGQDELEYSLIVEDLAGPKPLFQTSSLEKWRKDNSAEGLNQVTLRNRLAEDLQDKKSRAISRCEKFLASYPDSPRAAAVLWVQGHTRSMLLDEAAYHDGRVRYSAAFTTVESGPIWRRLIEEYPGTHHAALASLKLGELALREGNVKQADKLLLDSANRLRSILAKVAQETDESEPSRTLAPEPDVPAQRNYAHYKNALLIVERLIWLVEQNNVLEDKRSAEALAEYLKLNSQEMNHCKHLEALAGIYEDTPMGDNLKLAVAQTTTDIHERAQMLIQLADNKTTDAAIEASFALGLLARSTARDPAIRLIMKLKKPEEYFSAIVAARDNPWQRPAQAELTRLTSHPKPLQR